LRLSIANLFIKAQKIGGSCSITEVIEQPQYLFVNYFSKIQRPSWRGAAQDLPLRGQGAKACGFCVGVLQSKTPSFIRQGRSEGGDFPPFNSYCANQSFPKNLQKLIFFESNKAKSPFRPLIGVYKSSGRPDDAPVLAGVTSFGGVVYGMENLYSPGRGSPVLEFMRREKYGAGNCGF
jgi:hypothetical protein